VKISYRQAASDDVRPTAQSLRQHPFLGILYPLRNSQLQNLRFWPVTGFEAIGLYYFVDNDTIRVIRILHGKRDVRRILEQEGLEGR
jgi:plasmid stabilization system protein ParE